MIPNEKLLSIRMNANWIGVDAVWKCGTGTLMASNHNQKTIDNRLSRLLVPILFKFLLILRNSHKQNREKIRKICSIGLDDCGEERRRKQLAMIRLVTGYFMEAIAYP